MKGRRAQNGVALLTALLVVAIATLLIAGLLDQGRIGLSRTNSVAKNIQADQLADGAERWAMTLLKKDLASEAGIDTQNDVWHAVLPPISIEGGKLSARMQDRNGCFNLNTLAGESADQNDIRRQRFRRLLTALKLDPNIADAVVDWVDRDFEQGPQGAEDSAYAGGRLAYRAANRPMADVSELRLVKGVNAATYRKLLPHVCALPSSTTINVNTATIPVLMMLDDRIDESKAKLLSRNGNAQYATITEFLNELERLGVIGLPTVDLDVKSTYFETVTRVVLDGLVFTYASVIRREAGKLGVIARGKPSP